MRSACRASDWRSPTAPARVREAAISPDGTRLALRVEHAPLLVETSGERDATCSPDGKWFAYETNETGRNEIYIQPYPAGSGATQ